MQIIVVLYPCSFDFRLAFNKIYIFSDDKKSFLFPTKSHKGSTHCGREKDQLCDNIRGVDATVGSSCLRFPYE